MFKSNKVTNEMLLQHIELLEDEFLGLSYRLNPAKDEDFLEFNLGDYINDEQYSANTKGELAFA
jgi:hypothetical protein